MKKILSLIIIMAFCSMQCAFATTYNSNGYGITMTPMPTGVSSQPAQNSLNATLQQATHYGKGKKLKAFLQNDVSTTDAVKGDPIVVVLSENWYENGEAVAEAGSVINGIITSSNAAGGWSKDGALKIDFKTMETPDGRIYGLHAEPIEIQVEKERDSKWKTAAKVGGTILAAAAIGALWGLASSPSGTKTTTTTTRTENGRTTTTRSGADKDYGKGATVGAAVGAGLGVAVAIGAAAFRQGDNITIPANTNFEIELLDDVTVQSY